MITIFSKSCQQDEEFYTNQYTHNELISTVQEGNSNNDNENAVHKLRFLEEQYESKLHEIKNLIDDVKLRDYEIKNLQECITYLLQEKNDLQTKIKVHIFFSFAEFFFWMVSYKYFYFDLTVPGRGISEQISIVEEKI